MSLDDTRGNFLNRVIGFCGDRSFAIHWLSQGIHHATKHCLAYGNLEKLTGRFDLLTFFDAGVIAQHDGTHFSFLKVQGQTHDSVSEIDHLIEHRIRQPFNLGDTVANFPDNSNILTGNRLLGTTDLRFNFLQ